MGNAIFILSLVVRKEVCNRLSIMVFIVDNYDKLLRTLLKSITSTVMLSREPRLKASLARHSAPRSPSLGILNMKVVRLNLLVLPPYLLPITHTASSLL